MSTIPPIHVYSPIAPMGDREIEVLRVLGRLGLMTTSDIALLAFPGIPRRTQQYTLKSLADRGLVWRLRTNIGTRKNINIVGLTTDGRDHLAIQNVEPDDGSLQRLIARDRRAPPPGMAALVSDLTISGWCASMLVELRKLPNLVGVACQTHWTTFVDTQKNRRQVLDAGLVISIDPQQKTYNRPPTSIPWIESIVWKSSWTNRAWALIVDNGAQSDRSIRFDAELFPLIHQQGIYNKLMRGMPRPVILVPTGRRFARVAEQWRDVWPETPALISTVDRVAHPTFGALWGRYRAVKDTSGSDFSLLDGMVATPEQWANLTKNSTPDGGS
jgi:hypothetical protein